MERAFISLGSNLGDRMANLATAVDKIAGLEATHVDAVSHAYDSEPWGEPGQPAFANAVAEIHTEYTPEQLLDALKDIEREMGRVPGPTNAPRPIDLDIVMYGDAELSTPAQVQLFQRLRDQDPAVTPALGWLERRVASRGESAELGSSITMMRASVTSARATSTSCCAPMLSSRTRTSSTSPA
jgi:2-amino-4-hydroxy-6-hydroxymethyldihydropteridine diphosphokinase